MAYIIFPINDPRVTFRLGAVRDNLNAGDTMTVYLAEFSFSERDKYRAVANALVKSATEEAVVLVIDPHSIRTEWDVVADHGEWFGQAERERRYSALMDHPKVVVTFGQE